MQRVYLLTNAFPFFPGEQFLEREILFWAEARDVQLIILPRTGCGSPRSLPPTIIVDKALAKPLRLLEKVRWVAAALASCILWREARFLLGTHRFHPSFYLEALRSAALVLGTAARLHRVVERLGEGIVYGYWNDLATYAAAQLKRQGASWRIVSRAHRYDLYEDARPRSYMPLKRQFAGDIDRYFAIGEEGKQYLETRYACPPGRVLVSRLGVSIPEGMARCSDAGSLCVVSVSSCTPVKRVDKIIEALGIAAEHLRGVQVSWTHIGSGLLEPDLRALAQERLSAAQVDWRFTGHMSNAEVLTFFHDHPVDLFINASESEGIPVSIMEAMSFGIPAVAPDVGGVREVVDDTTGYLLKTIPSATEIAIAIIQAYDGAKAEPRRKRAKASIVQKYCATQNYRSFIDLAIGRA